MESSNTSSTLLRPASKLPVDWFVKDFYYEVKCSSCYLIIPKDAPKGTPCLACQQPTQRGNN